MSHFETETHETIENLISAYSGERNTAARYIAFAVQADKEGYLGIASLFRAVAHSEQVHATNHARALRELGAELHINVLPLDVKNTAENLRTALQGEGDESEQMYPEFADHARAEHCDAAVDTFESASEAEASHAHMFAMALDNLNDHCERSVYYVCTLCGWVSTSASFKRCVLCNNPKEHFDRID